MAYNYSTCTPYYFEYLASSMTREDMLADNDLCKFLQNPLHKDNMEMAFRWQEAKYGGYDEKYAFVEYFLCNGPELDTDTIMYYREKCYQDPIYIDIAEIQFNNIEVLTNLRTTVYNKSTSDDLSNCFTNPCNYLGPLSSCIGMMGDSNNFRTMPNIFSTLLKGSDEDKKELMTCWGNIRTHITNKLLPNIRGAAQVMYDSMYDHAKTFAEECKKAGLTSSADIGDPHSIARADGISSATKVNTYSRLGDCARLWEHMRRFNPYENTQNKKQPIPEDKIVANRNVNGASIDRKNSAPLTSKIPPAKLNTMAAAGNKKAIYEKELQELDIPITMEEYQKLTDPKLTEEERLKYGKELLINNSYLKYKDLTNAYIEKYKDDNKALDALQKQVDEQTDLKHKVFQIVHNLEKKSQEIEELMSLKDDSLTEEQANEVIDYGSRNTATTSSLEAMTSNTIDRGGVGAYAIANTRATQAEERAAQNARIESEVLKAQLQIELEAAQKAKAAHDVDVGNSQSNGSIQDTYHTLMERQQ